MNSCRILAPGFAVAVALTAWAVPAPPPRPATPTTAASPRPPPLPGARAESPPPAPTTSVPATAAPPAAPPRTVVIDPGHNGGNGANAAQVGRPVPDGRGGIKPCNTTGASTADGYPEHAFTWAVSLRLADELRARGMRVVLTRPSDDGVGPCVDERGAAGAAAGADAVVSVHADGAAPYGRGFHVIYASPPLSPSQGEPSRSLAATTAQALRAGGFAPSDYIGEGGLDGRDDLAGLNLSRVPSVIVECGNLRNAADAALARSSEGQARYAAALADAVGRWTAR